MADRRTRAAGASGRNAPLAGPVEIRTLLGMLDDLDYYEILKIERGSAPAQIRTGYQQQSLIFHPDRFLTSQDTELRDAVNRIAKRIKEAYAVLRHPVKRTQYNQVLLQGGHKKGFRFTRETALAARQAREEELGKTPRGREFFRQAQGDAKKGDTQAALRNIKMALAYEPDNPRFLALRDELSKGSR
ncbi:MAG: J domain-containing protein [Myxococcota bacterium]